VRALADALLAACPRIDVLANNAGAIFAGTRSTTVDGHESTFQVNYLAPFLLTELLHDRLVESRATVINTSSVAGARFGRLDLDDLQSEHGYSPSKAYGASKLAQILHAKELDRRYGALGLSAASFHPGGIASNFSTNEGSPWRFLYRSRLKNLLLASTAQGADTLVWLAQTPPHEGWEPGGYYVKRGRAASSPWPTTRGSQPGCGSAASGCSGSGPRPGDRPPSNANDAAASRRGLLPDLLDREGATRACPYRQVGRALLTVPVPTPARAAGG